jgi:hypothetical protein
MINEFSYSNLSKDIDSKTYFSNITATNLPSSEIRFDPEDISTTKNIIHNFDNLFDGRGKLINEIRNEKNSVYLRIKFTKGSKVTQFSKEDNTIYINYEKSDSLNDLNLDELKDKMKSHLIISKGQYEGTFNKVKALMLFENLMSIINSTEGLSIISDIHVEPNQNDFLYDIITNALGRDIIVNLYGQNINNDKLKNSSISIKY